MQAQQNWMEIRHLKIKTKIGIHAWEQQIEQSLLLDITLPIPHHSAPYTLEKTIDYSVLCQQVTEFISNRSFDLIENVAEEIADLILNAYPINLIQVAVSKPWAVANAGNITVKIEKKRPEK